MEVRPMQAALGAEVRCGDLRALDDAAVAGIRRAWLAHLVVLFRDQQLADADLVAFGRRFGELQRSVPLPSPLANEGKVRQGVGDGRYPEVTVVSNVVENGVALGGLGDGELFWHSDMSSYEAPPNQTILYAVEVPAGQGRTGFTNMYAACDALPAELRAEVDRLALKHDATIDAAGYLRKRFADADTDIRVSPGATHPLICTHAETGANCLYLGRRSKAYVTELPVTGSEALLDRLWAHATQPQFAWHHEWRPGDVLMWDNRCVMHRRDAFDPAARRVLHRVVVRGTAPARAPGTLPPHPRSHATN